MHETALKALETARRFWRIIDEENLVPDEAIGELRSLGLFRQSQAEPDVIMESVRAISRYSPGLAHVVLVSYSSYIATGVEGLLALSITEPGGGTDIRANLKTVASGGAGGPRITGERIFTSNAPYADYFVVLAQGPSGPSLYLARPGEGVEYEVLEVTGLRGSGASRVVYRDAPAEPVVEGDGLRRALAGINVGRLGYALIALGIVDRALEIMVEAGNNKVIFGRRLLEYQGVQWRIAELEVGRRSLEALVERALRGLAAGRLDPVEAATAKVLGARLAQEAAWAASQILGGRGLARGSETERMLRDSRVLDIGEGAREVLLDFIAGKTIKALSRG